MKAIYITVTILFSFLLNSQNLNNEITNSKGQKILLGKIKKASLNQENYKSWFSKNYENYSPDENAIKDLQSNLNDYKITVFMGTWCGDSKREVPRFYKIIEALEFPENQMELIALSNDFNLYKQSPQHEENGLNIHRVPTFIFYKNGKEVNRIVEHPVESLEKDILKIVNDNNYEPNFEIVKVVNTILEDSGSKGLKRRQGKLIKDFGEKTKSYSELNTYGSILYTTNRLDEATEVYKLNLKLFPEIQRVYESLANIYVRQGKPKKAIKILKKAINKFPDNEVLIRSLNKLTSG